MMMMMWGTLVPLLLLLINTKGTLAVVDAIVENNNDNAVVVDVSNKNNNKKNNPTITSIRRLPRNDNNRGNGPSQGGDVATDDAPDDAKPADAGNDDDQIECTVEPIVPMGGDGEEGDDLNSTMFQCRVDDSETRSGDMIDLDVDDDDKPSLLPSGGAGAGKKKLLITGVGKQGAKEQDFRINLRKQSGQGRGPRGKIGGTVEMESGGDNEGRGGGRGGGGRGGGEKARDDNGSRIRPGRRGGPNRHQRQRLLEARRSGQKSVLVMRISNPNYDGCSLPENATTVSRRVFGGYDDLVNLRDQTYKCSFGQLEFIPAVGSNITNGVIDVNVTKNCTTSNENAILNEATSEADRLTGVAVDSYYDFIIKIMPPGAKSGVAYAFLNGRVSVYNSKWGLSPIAQMHEVGHNLGLHHSGEINQWEYGDMSGYMGAASTSNHELVEKCFHSPANWYLGWYESREITVEASNYTIDNPWIGKVIGLVDYANSTLNEHYVNVLIPNSNEPNHDIFITYNRQKSFNIGTQEHENKVLITYQPPLTSLSAAQKKSVLQRALNVGTGAKEDSYWEMDYEGFMITLVINVKSFGTENVTGVDYALVEIYTFDQTPYPTMSPYPSIQPSTSDPPSNLASFSPTLAPSISFQPSAFDPGPYTITSPGCSVCHLTKGHFFNIKATYDITIKEIMFRPYGSGDMQVEIYTKAGTWIGFNRDSSSWNKIATYNFTHPGGWCPQFRVPMDNFDPITVRREGEYDGVQGFYVTLTGNGNQCHGKLSEGETADTVVETNHIQIFKGGAAAIYPFAYSWTPRPWTGGFTYIRETGLPPTEPPTNKPSAVPSTGTPTKVPSYIPSNTPTTPNPTKNPTSKPSLYPSSIPSFIPSSTPTKTKSLSPSSSYKPSLTPSIYPTRIPTVDNEMVATMAGGYVGGKKGGMFDIYSHVDMRIISFKVGLHNVDTNMEVWTKSGTCNGFFGNQNSWNKLCSTFVTNAGYRKYSIIPYDCFEPVTLLRGETRAFYLPTIDDGANIAYSTNGGYALGDTYSSNADMEIKIGGITNYPFGYTWKPRRWNGSVLYTIDGTHVPTSAPSLAPTNSAVPTISPSISILPSALPSMNPTHAPTIDRYITATMQGGYVASNRGGMFDIVANVDIRIISFTTNLSGQKTQPHAVEIWTKDGTCQGYQRNQGAWTNICSASVTSLGYNKKTPLPYNCFNPIVIKQGERRAFYIPTTNGENMSYSSSGGHSLMDVYSSNEDLNVLIGYATTYPFGYSWSPRRWNGEIIYTVDGSHSPSILPTSSPSISNKPSYAITNIPSRSIVQDEELVTFYNGGESGDAIMLDVTAKIDLRIAGFVINLQSPTATIKVYTTLSGSSVGHEHDSSFWTLLGTATISKSTTGDGTPLPNHMFTPVAVGLDETKGFLISTSNAGEYIGYSVGSNPGGIVVENQDLSINEGEGYTFDSSRIFNGAVIYTLDGVTHDPTPAPVVGQEEVGGGQEQTTTGENTVAVTMIIPESTTSTTTTKTTTTTTTTTSTTTTTEPPIENPIEEDEPEGEGEEGEGEVEEDDSGTATPVATTAAAETATPIVDNIEDPIEELEDGM